MLRPRSTLRYTPGPHLTLFFGTMKDSYYVRLPLSETNPFQTEPLPQCDISFTLGKFALIEKFINSH